MRRVLCVVLFLATVSGVGLYLSTHAAQTTPPAKASTDDLRLSGPYTHANLSLFLVHGADTMKTADFLTLAEALEQKVFVIKETQSVNQLEMQNLSDKTVIILSGDIVTGGQQDRIAQNDQVVSAKSAVLPLRCFCVEHTASRWMEKIDEKNGTFKASPGCVASNSLRLANRAYGAQGKVWSDVEKLQKKLSENVKTEVKDAKSDSSLALSLDHKKVLEEIEAYIKVLAEAPKGKADTLGYVFAINGKFVSADVYGSAKLFEKVWPRLVRASAIEALAEMKKDEKFAAPTETTCRKFLRETEVAANLPAPAEGWPALAARAARPNGPGGEAATESKSAAKKDSGKSLLFESTDKENGVLRRNILAR
jgi:hypothetical protein